MSTQRILFFKTELGNLFEIHKIVSVTPGTGITWHLRDTNNNIHSISDCDKRRLEECMAGYIYE